MDAFLFFADHADLQPANDDSHAQWLKDYGSDRACEEPSRCLCGECDAR